MNADDLLRELKQYARHGRPHGPVCDANKHSDYACNCGLDELLARIDAHLAQNAAPAEPDAMPEPKTCDICGTDLVPCCPTCIYPRPSNWPVQNPKIYHCPEYSDGALIRLEDYDALRAECERLRGEAEYWKMKAVHCAESLAQLHGKLAAT